MPYYFDQAYADKTIGNHVMETHDQRDPESSLHDKYDLETILTEEECGEIIERSLSLSNSMDLKRLSLHDIVKILKEMDITYDRIDAAIDIFFKDRKNRISNPVNEKAKELESMLLGLNKRIDIDGYDIKTSIPCIQSSYLSKPLFSIVYHVKRRYKNKPLIIDVTKYSPKIYNRPLYTIKIRSKNNKIFDNIEIILRKEGVNKISLENFFEWYIEMKNSDTDKGRIMTFAIENIKQGLFEKLEMTINNLTKISL
jgi:hypothetical protein